MRAIVVTCPQCGANLSVDGAVSAVTCTYCGTEARIQQRSRVFQVPQPLPRQPQASPGPVARQQVSKAIFILPFVIVTSVVAGSFYFSSQARRAVERAVDTGKSGMDWYGSAPVLADVDGDGADDLIGFARYIIDGDRVHLAAFSGKTGAPLWQSEQLGTGSTISQTVMAAAGELVYVATDDGVLHARDRKTGTLRWETRLGEKVQSLCAGAAAGELVVHTADDKWSIVDGAGALRPGTALVRLDRSGSKPDDALATFAAIGPEGQPGVCMPIDNVTWQRPVPLLTIDNWSTMPKIDGMYVERLVRRPGGPVLAVGYKSPGTSVPMLARADGPQIRWTTEIPSRDPLTSSSDDKLIGLSDHAAFVLYEPRNGSSATIVAAFDLADGHRLWEREVRHGIGSLNVVTVVATGDVVLVASWGALQAFDQKDGGERYLIGTI